MSETKQATRSAFEELRENVTDAAATLGTSAKEFTRDALKETQDCAASFYEQGRAKTQKAEQTLETMIRARPLKAIMIAAGIGLLLGGIGLRR